MWVLRVVLAEWLDTAIVGPDADCASRSTSIRRSLIGSDIGYPRVISRHTNASVESWGSGFGVGAESWRWWCGCGCGMGAGVIIDDVVVKTTVRFGLNVDGFGLTEVCGVVTGAFGIVGIYKGRVG